MDGGAKAMVIAYSPAIGFMLFMGISIVVIFVASLISDCSAHQESTDKSNTVTPD